MTDTTHSHASAQLPSHGFRSLELPRLIMERPHRHNDVERLNFVEAKALTYLLGGATVGVPGGQSLRLLGRHAPPDHPRHAGNSPIGC
ncbi:MAG: hypothetical protein R3A10_05420 [Caldilineaceae bacterium]